MILRALADPAHPQGGHAILDVPLAGPPPADARFRITREGWARGTLGPEGWQVGEALLAPLRVEPIAGGARLFLGPDIVDQLEAGPLWFRWPAAGIEAALFWPDIAPLHAGAPPPPPAPKPTPPAPEPRVMPRAPEPAAPLAPPPPAPRRAPWLLAAALLLLAGGAGWWLTRGAPGPSPSAERIAAPAPAPPPAAPPETLSVAEVIARAASIAAISEEAARRHAQGRHDDALLLWEHAARNGHAPAMTALARLYDPNGFTPGRPFRDPDPRQAARFYREAEAAGDTAAAAPRAALRAALEARAAAGDAVAPLTLRDFWP